MIFCPSRIPDAGSRGRKGTRYSTPDFRSRGQKGTGSWSATLIVTNLQDLIQVQIYPYISKKTWTILWEIPFIRWLECLYLAVGEEGLDGWWAGGATGPAVPGAARTHETPLWSPSPFWELSRSCRDRTQQVIVPTSRARTWSILKMAVFTYWAAYPFSLQLKQIKNS